MPDGYGRGGSPSQRCGGAPSRSAVSCGRRLTSETLSSSHTLRAVPSPVEHTSATKATRCLAVT